MSHKDIQDLRREYTRAEFNTETAEADPFKQFETWFNNARDEGLLDVTAMTLATRGIDGYPAARVVLLKDYNEEGFIFFTNYSSAKAREIEADNRASLLFYWHEFERQIRISGDLKKVASEESAEYFKSRPLESQWGAYASRQSSEVENRAELEKNYEQVKNKYGENVPAPDFWGGFILHPVRFEFWQGRANRLHDRLVYEKSGSEYSIKRLAP